MRDRPGDTGHRNRQKKKFENLGTELRHCFRLGLSQLLVPRSILSVFVVKVIARYSHPQGHRGLTETQSKTLGHYSNFLRGLIEGIWRITHCESLQLRV